MSNENFYTKIKRLHRRLNGSTIEYDLSEYRIILESITRLNSEYENNSDYELKSCSQKLIARARQGETLDSLLNESFALVNESIRRILRINPFDEQIIGGIVMHRGKLAEMQTGEGKTLTAVFPVYLNALTGMGVHVLTFNDYLAKRDSEWMGPIFTFLGLSVGFVQEGMSIEQRKWAYNCDVTYLTAKESGFDFLRDSLSYTPEKIVQRKFNYALVDEADSILIDEARIPLVIAGSSEDDEVKNDHNFTEIVNQLAEGKDYEFDEYKRNIQLTDHGIKRIEETLGVNNLYDEQNTGLLSKLNCALHAEYLLIKNVDYIIRNGKVELVDEFTGRVAEKRRFQDGLQEAIESKEKLNIQSKGKILNLITLQHFVRLYPKLCGMTATAEQAEEEFRKFYGLDIVVIPSNRPCVRIDQADYVFQTKEEKLAALTEEIVSVHKTNRPILVGTRSVEESSILAGVLKSRGLKCEVLNAKRDEHEAKIIANAGKPGALTISTNMAGRGTDIRLGGNDAAEKKEIISLGGLYVIGTNRHESRRIDNQLRGRAGRQGDPGSSRFFISLEDDLFIKYRLSELFPSRQVSEFKLKNKIIVREVNRVQRIIEGQNLEIKKTLCQYSSLLEQQRKEIHRNRNNILFHDSFADYYISKSPFQFKRLIVSIGKDNVIELCRKISLYNLDKYWSDFLSEIESVREGIHLTRFGGENPLLVFQKLSIDMFDRFLEEADNESINIFNSLNLVDNKEDLTKMGIKMPAATWTYLINDNPFENNLEIAMAGNIGLSAAIGFMWPLLVIYSLVKKSKRKKEN
jgi:preprotein translocase subunit SecA